MRKTTKADFKEFKKQFLKWQNYFGLKNWESCFTNIPDKDPASLWTDLEGYLAIINFSTEIDDDNDCRNDLVKFCAFHECCELLLARLRALAKSRFVIEQEITEANHEIVRTLENTLYKDVKI